MPLSCCTPLETPFVAFSEQKDNAIVLTAKAAPGKTLLINTVTFAFTIHGVLQSESELKITIEAKSQCKTVIDHVFRQTFPEGGSSPMPTLLCGFARLDPFFASTDTLTGTTCVSYTWNLREQAGCSLALPCDCDHLTVTVESSTPTLRDVVKSNVIAQGCWQPRC